MYRHRVEVSYRWDSYGSVTRNTACPNKHCAWKSRWLSQKSARLADQILKHFTAYGLVYNWWKIQENQSTQTRDIIDFIRLYHFSPTQLESCSKLSMLTKNLRRRL